MSWIVGNGWNQNDLGRLPRSSDLDAVCADIPVVLRRICHHICVVNTTAMKIGTA